MRLDKVWVWGPPRRGSTSVAAALSLLGYDVVHFCPLTHTDTAVEFTNQLVDNSGKSLISTGNFFGEYILDVVDYIDWPLILLDRDEALWRQSVADFNYDSRKAEYIYNELLDTNKGLVYNAIDGWEPLCLLLSKEIPDVEFPRLNQGPSNYAI